MRTVLIYLVGVFVAIQLAEFIIPKKLKLTTTTDGDISFSRNDDSTRSASPGIDSSLSIYDVSLENEEGGGDSGSAALSCATDFNFDGLRNWEINALRRRLALGVLVTSEQDSNHDRNNNCYRALLPRFRNHTLARRHQARIFHLHIPRTGGKTLCKIVRSSNITFYEDSNNCWFKSFYPWWTRFEGMQRYTPCSALPRLQFIANERWLDHHDDNRNNKTASKAATTPFCQSHNFIVTLREPVSHRMSMNKNPDYRNNYHREVLAKNYFTWALLAGRELANNKDRIQRTLRPQYRPSPEDISAAKEILLGFDYILDWSALEDHPLNCSDTIMVLNGLLKPSQLPPEEIKIDRAKDYRGRFNRSKIADSNGIDIELYNYAKELMRVDCEYYDYVLRYTQLALDDDHLRTNGR